MVGKYMKSLVDKLATIKWLITVLSNISISSRV